VGLLLAGSDAGNTLARFNAVDNLDIGQGLAGQKQRLDRDNLGGAVELDQLPRHLGAAGNACKTRFQGLMNPK